MAEKEYIARISYGKDSLKMLEVIRSRGLPLDRITTTDVWATDTISANLPPWLPSKSGWTSGSGICIGFRWSICAPGTRMAASEPMSRCFIMFRFGNRGGYKQGTIRGFPDLWNPWCQAGLKRNAHAPSTRHLYRLPSQQQIQLVSEAQNTLLGAGSSDGLCQTRDCNGANISNQGPKHPF